MRTATAPHVGARTRVVTWGWLTADIASWSGTRLAALAIPWLVLTTTGSATLTGIVVAAEMAPLVIARALGGPLIDRVGAPRAAVAADAASTVTVALVPVLWLAGHLSFGALVAIVAVVGALRGPADAAKHALIPALTRHTGRPLEFFTGIAGTVERLASTVGAALGGALVAVIGAAPALGVTAGCFATSGLLVGLIVGPRLRVDSVGAPADPSPDVETTGVETTDGSTTKDESTDGESTASGYLGQLREGAAFLRREPVLLGITIMLSLTNALDVAWASVLVPASVLDRDAGPETVGVIFKTMSGAAIAGALLATLWAARLPRLPVYVVAFLLAGAPRFVALSGIPGIAGGFAAHTPVWLCLAVIAVAGFGSGFLNPILGAVIFERIPAPLVGRVSSLTNALAWSLMPVGGLVGGVLVDRLGVSPALWWLGLAFLAAAMLPVVVPSWRRFGDRVSTDV